MESGSVVRRQRVYMESAVLGASRVCHEPDLVKQIRDHQDEADLLNQVPLLECRSLKGQEANRKPCGRRHKLNPYPRQGHCKKMKQ